MDWYFTELIGPYPTAPGAPFSTFTTRQDVSPQPLPVFSAFKLRPGTQIEIDARGEFSTTGTPTLVMGFYIGTAAAVITTPLAESGVITTGSGAAAWPWEMHWEGMCSSVTPAGSGSLVGSGTLLLGTSLTAFAQSAIPITQALRTVTIDTTIARAIGVCATWGTSSASNIVKVNKHNLLVKN